MAATKPKKEESNIMLTMDEAVIYLKSIDEWQSASKFDRDLIIKWASFLKNKGVK